MASGRSPAGGAHRRQAASIEEQGETVAVVYCLLGLVLVAILPVVGLVQLRGQWPDGAIALIIPILTLAALRGSPRHLAVTARYGALLGLLLVGMGVGHLVGVTSVARSAGTACDSRHVFLITLGGILVCTGLGDLAATRAIRQGAQTAISLAAFRTVSLIAFLGLLLPLPDGGGNTSATARLSPIGRLWAVAKFFHPAVLLLPVDWDSAVVVAIPRVIASRSTGEFAARFRLGSILLRRNR